jgi:hypothetical protein
MSAVIAGNASAATKARVCQVVESFQEGFGASIGKRLVVVAVSFDDEAVDSKSRARVAVETPVEEGECSLRGIPNV